MLRVWKSANLAGGRLDFGEGVTLEDLVVQEGEDDYSHLIKMDRDHQEDLCEGSQRLKGRMAELGIGCPHGYMEVCIPDIK